MASSSSSSSRAEILAQQVTTYTTKILNLDTSEHFLNSVLIPFLSLVNNNSNVGAEIKATIGGLMEAHITQVSLRVKAIEDPLDFLVSYSSEWNRFKISIHCFGIVLSKIFPDPSQTKQGAMQPMRKNPATNTSSAQQIRTYCYAFWKTALLDPLKSRIQPAIFELLGHQRAGGAADLQTIRNAVDSYKELDITLTTYRVEFEDPFLDHTSSYYTAAAASSLQKDGVCGYLNFCDRVLDLEEKIAEQYLAPVSHAAHKDRVNQTIITNHRSVLQEALSDFVASGNRENLRRIYRLFERIDQLTPLLEIFCKHVEGAFLKTIADLVPLTKAADKAVQLAFPTTYCQAFLSQYHEFAEIIRYAFKDNPRFFQGLERVARQTLNENAIHEKNDPKEPSAQLAARYADAILTDKTIDISELKENRLMLQGVRYLCVLLNAKDVFCKFYKTLYCNRLLKRSIHSVDAETFMIQLLRSVHSLQYSQELLVMQRDVDSKDKHSAAFIAKLPPSAPVFDPLILTASSWPLNPWDKTVTMNLPAELQTISDQFKEHFEKTTEVKTIQWIHERSSVVLDFSVKGQKFTITCNHFQAGIILALVGKQMVTIEELSPNLNLSPEFLNAAMTSLLKTKLVQTNKEKYRLNPAFQNPSRIIDITPIFVRPLLQDPEAEVKEIEEQREQYTQAAIVRIMKARKVIDHAALIEETTKQTSRFFPQKVERIKRQIEKLITGQEKYIDRVDNRTYKYVTEETPQ